MKVGKTTLSKFLVRTILLLTLVTHIPIFLWYSGSLKQSGFSGSLGWNVTTIIVFLLLPLTYFFFTLSIFRRTLRSPLAIPPVFFKEIKWANITLFVTMLFLNFLLIVITWLAVYDVFTEKPPQFFPFDDPQGTYVIEQYPENTMYWIHYRHLPSNEDGSHIYIGHSPVDLEPFLNKEVILKGKFVYSKEQCMVHVCSSFQGNNNAVLDIETIRLKANSTTAQSTIPINVANWKTYTNKESGISFKYPETWNYYPTGTETDSVIDPKSLPTFTPTTESLGDVAFAVGVLMNPDYNHHLSKLGLLDNVLSQEDITINGFTGVHIKQSDGGNYILNFHDKALDFSYSIVNGRDYGKEALEMIKTLSEPANQKTR